MWLSTPLQVLDRLGVRGLFTSSPCYRSRSCWGNGKRRAIRPLLPEGVDPRGRHHCGPKQYIGKTPEQIVEQFKDPATFPWYQVPEPLRQRRFEVLWQMAHRCGYRSALEAVKLLTNPAHDGRPEAPVEGEPGRPQRLQRSQLRALRSGTPAVPAYGKGPRAAPDTE
ncbi:hypothetical protein AK812_SmicGene28623 [Symbiodinium microadriaticum]|uniref:Uncharacterized protein n=1 Tax=Symbiodinium microadriaticum TaxID=2951 RepID=A0A1Q9D3Y7_SYMMI|nr:hypothetical protein AK812_SmicGene28623 [Symbiodinium microadriaticum]CAE7036999.1 unnamed protein product [Symbiodinium sp. KB8]CAE7490702.1 unnamed protein product [Symbiodinium microadriaticum]